MLCALFVIFILVFLIGTCLGSYKEWNGGSTPYPLLFPARKVQRRKNRMGKVKCSLLTLPVSQSSKQWCTFDIYLIKAEKAQTVEQFEKMYLDK